MNTTQTLRMQHMKTLQQHDGIRAERIHGDFSLESLATYVAFSWCVAAHLPQTFQCMYPIDCSSLLPEHVSGHVNIWLQSYWVVLARIGKGSEHFILLGGAYVITRQLSILQQRRIIQQGHTGTMIQT